MSSLVLRIVAAIVLLAALVAGGLSVRKAYSERDQFRHERDEARASAEDYQRRVLESNKLAEARSQSAERIRTVTKEIVREVPIRIPAAACPLVPDWRVLHDQAAAGQHPAAPR